MHLVPVVKALSFVEKSPSAPQCLLASGGSLSAGGKDEAINTTHPQLPGPAPTAVHKPPNETPDWALAYGQEFWRRKAGDAGCEP